MARTGRPKTKEDTTTARIRKSDNAAVVTLAEKAGVSVPDYFHILISREKPECKSEEV